MYLKPFIFYLFSFLLLSVNAFGQSFNLMTYNIRLDVESDGINKWDLRKEVLAAQIHFYEPDILGIQEGLPNQVNYLQNNLKNYKHIGIGREGVNKGESASIFYNTQRLLLVKQNTFWLSETPQVISKGWDASYLRVCTYGLFTDKKTNRQFWVFNCHLDNNGEIARAKSIELIVKTIHTVNPKRLPVILMGDFNATPDAEVIINLKRIMNDARAASVTQPFGPEGTFNNFEFTQPVTKLIDYIFTSKSDQIIVKKYAVLSDSYYLKYPSDHLPVFAQINMIKK